MKMKKTSPLLSVLLAMLMTASLFSCGKQDGTSAGQTGGETTAADTEAATTADDGLVHDDLPAANYDGAKYAVVGDGQVAIAVTADELNGETVNDAKYNASRRVEKRFNVSISHDTMNETRAGGFADYVAELIASGDDKYSVMIAQPEAMATAQMTGAFYNLRNVSQFNYEKPWWTKETDQVAIGKDKAYLASSFFTYFPILYARLMVINKDVADAFQLKIPYEKVYAGTWYMDDMLEMCAAATADKDGDGVMGENDYWGLSYQLSRFVTFQGSQEITVFGKDANNMPYVNFNAERAQPYLEKVEKLIRNYGFDGQRNQGVAHFVNGNSLFCYCYLRSVCEIIRDSEITYGFLLTPKLDEKQKDYIMSGGDQYWAIPTTAVRRLDMIGTVTEAISCECYNNVIPAFYESTMKSKLSDSPDDAQVLTMIPATLRVRFEQIYGSNLPNAKTLTNLISSTSSDSVVSTFKSVEAAINAELENVVKLYNALP